MIHERRDGSIDCDLLRPPRTPDRRSGLELVSEGEMGVIREAETRAVTVWMRPRSRDRARSYFTYRVCDQDQELPKECTMK